MASRWMAASAALAVLVWGWAPGLASAADGDVGAQLGGMQTRIERLSQTLEAADARLDAAKRRIEAQDEQLESAGLAEKKSRGASSGLGCLLCDWTIGGWLAGSYFWNINDPQDNEVGDFGGDFISIDSDDDGVPDVPPSSDGGSSGLANTNQGVNGAFYPYHPDHNSFAFDQLWLEIEKQISEENRAGFRLDTVYGKTAAMIGGPSNRDRFDDTAFYILEASVQYLAPIGDGLTFKMGKFGTLIGNEYAQTIYNWNITHSSVFNLLQPLDHIGIIAFYEFGETGFDAALGGVNGFFPDDPDINDEKSILGHLGWANDTISVGVNGIWGGEVQGFDGDQTGVVDLVVTFDPSDRLGFWVNADYNWQQESDAAAWGVAAAMRFGFTEKTAIALRGEYVQDVDRFLGFCGFGGSFVPADASESCAEGSGDPSEFTNFVVTGVQIFGVTATLSHLLTDHLMIRGEVRWDHIAKDNTDDGDFFGDRFDPGREDFGLESDQVVVGAEVVYNFNAFGGDD